MSDMEQIEIELREYIKKSENLNKEDQFILLRSLFKRYFEIDKMQHNITISDLKEIIGQAKTEFGNTILPMKISGRDVYPEEVPHVAFIEAFIGYLNKFKVLKRMIKIDYTRR